jgi:capsular polysaccharide biosynthesis protein
MAGPDDDWFESEELTRLGMIVETQRIRRRTRARPIPAILLACAVTTFITYKLAVRRPAVEAEVVLALTEGSLSQKHHGGLPVEELHDFVSNVLLPNAKVLELIQRRNLYPLRHKLGDEFAIEQLRSQLDIEIWKNTFVTAEASDERSARIGLTVTDSDPDRAFDLARDLATVVIETAQDQRQEVTKHLTAEVSEMRDRLRERFDRLSRETAEKEAAQLAARRAGNEQRAHAIELELAVLWREERKTATTLATIATSRDSLADEISEAGLDMSVTVVEEHRPPRPESRNFVLAMIAVVIGVGSLLGSALLLGAFDSRVHDLDDVERLSIPVLGHLPGFPGDDVGSLRSRGAARARVPSFLRWRSHR